jgi:formate transporter
MGILVRDHARAEFWARTGLAPGDFPDVNWGDALLANLLPVTLGNVIGGSVMVGLVYWAVYLRPRPAHIGHR